MHQFTDNTGATWDVTINVATIKRVLMFRPEIDLTRPHAGEPPLGARLATEPLVVCDSVYCLVKDQLDAKKVSEDEFNGRMGGSGLASATTAFWEEYEDFFQGLGRTDLLRLLSVQRQLLQQSDAAAADELEAIVSNQKNEQNRSTDGSSSMGSPESSESTPTPSPSASSTGWPPENSATNGTVAV